MSAISGREQWSSRWGFILVATGAAAGLGNIWKFPYIVGEHGGGAFMLIYLVCILAVGLPVLAAELLLGRLGNHNVVDSFKRVATASARSKRWSIVGWIGLAAVFIVLSFYSVVGGWALAYLHLALTGALSAENMQSADDFVQTFDGVVENPVRVMIWHTMFMGVTAWVVGSGVRRGIETLALWLMPALFLLLVLLVAYGAAATDHFGAALRFLFEPDFSKLTAEAVLVALGHAFFTLSVGVGAMLTFGSYLPQNIGLAGASITVAGLDTLVAVLAGLAIFPIVFANGIEAGSGPGLVFVTLPIAFANMDGGAVIGILFFALLAIAALTSSPSLLEPMVEYARETADVDRKVAAWMAAIPVWLLGLGQALSFSSWSGVTAFGKNLFDLSDFLASNILLPAGGILIALFAGWVLPKSDASGPLGVQDRRFNRVWRIMLRYIAPAGVALVLLNGLL